MYKQKIFANALQAAETPKTAAPPTEDKLQLLEKDLTETYKKDKSDVQQQQQNGAGAMTSKQKELKTKYSVDDNIDYNSRLGNFSFQLSQNPLDTMKMTDTMLLSTLQAKDSLNLGNNFDEFSEDMLYSQRAQHKSEKAEKLGRKRPILSHDIRF